MELNELKFTVSGVEEVKYGISRVQILINELEKELSLLKEMNITIEPLKH
ncbi:MAG: hypothetical protein RR851_13865 [Clostridium sp.]